MESKSIEIVDLDFENSAQFKSVETDLESGKSANEPLESSLTLALISSALVSCADDAMTPTLDDVVQNAEPKCQDSNNFAVSPQPLHSDIAAVATDSPIELTNIRYPVTLYSNKPRSFNPDWFKLYPRLKYSVKEDA